MTTTKKVIIFIVMLMLALSVRVYATPVSEEVDDHFSCQGLIVSNWARQDVYNALINGLLDNSNLNHNSDLTISASREEVAEIAYEYVARATSQFKKDHIMAINGEVRFNDTDNIKVINAARLGLVNGKGNSNFHPHDTITREEVATIMHRAELLVWGLEGLHKPTNKANYRDNHKIAAWSSSSIDYFTYTGQLNGTGNGYFSPQGNMTREQAIVFINRLHRTRMEHVINNNQ